MIELNNVGVTFSDASEPVRAVDSVSFTACAGEFVLLSGASGSGKSTLLNVISGLQPFDSGTAVVAGVELMSAHESELAALRLEHVGVVFQENNLIREFNASENVQLPLRARGYTSQDAVAEAGSALAKVGIGELGRRMPTQLSGGQRQRVGIARALVGGRSILVADEPTGALDSTNSLAIFALLRGLADNGVCVVVASHDESAEAYSDRVVQMHDGMAAELGAKS